MLAILLCSIKLLKTEHDVKVRVKYQFSKGDIPWTNSSISKMALIALVGGMMSSLVGIGGGMIFNPVMISFGVHPSVSSSTSMYMVLLSTFSSSMQFFLLGMLPLDYTLGFGLIVTLATLIGLLTVNKVNKKYGRPSFLVLLLAFVIIVS